MVIGTVKGDIHDIGKNLVGMMMEGAGFEVVDLGINNAVEKYLAALEEHQPDILGMSALLTTTMPYMKVVIDTMKEKGIRDDYIVLVGGAPLNEEFGRAVGADAYCRDAAVAVETAKEFMKRKHNVRASACSAQAMVMKKPRNRGFDDGQLAVRSTYSTASSTALRRAVHIPADATDCVGAGGYARAQAMRAASEARRDGVMDGSPSLSELTCRRDRRSARLVP